MLALLLAARGHRVASCSRRAIATYVEQRVRAGLLEQNTVDLLHERRASASGSTARGSSTHGVYLRFDGRVTRDVDDAAPHRARKITIYGQQEVVKDLIAARLDARRAAALRGRRRRRCDDLERRAAHHLSRRRGRARARVRLHRRLRRLPRRLPRGDPAERCIASRARSIRSAGSASSPRPRRRARRADLRVPRARLRAALACARPRSAASTSRCPPTTTLDAGPTSGSGTSSSRRLARRRLAARRGPIVERGHHADAQLRRRADAARPPVPGRRRGAHRPADRRQGPQPRGRRRARARRRRWSRSTRTAIDAGAGRLLGDLPAPRLARAALLLVDDPAAAPLPGPGRRSRAPAARAARVRRSSRAAATSLAENYVGVEPEPLSASG